MADLISRFLPLDILRLPFGSMVITDWMFMAIFVLFGCVIYSIMISAKGSFKKGMGIFAGIWLAARVPGFLFFELPGGTQYRLFVALWVFSCLVEYVFIGYVMAHPIYKFIYGE